MFFKKTSVFSASGRIARGSARAQGYTSSYPPSFSYYILGSNKNDIIRWCKRSQQKLSHYIYAELKERREKKRQIHRFVANYGIAFKKNHEVVKWDKVSWPLRIEGFLEEYYR